MERFDSVFLGPSDRVSVRPRQDMGGIALKFGEYGELTVYLNAAQEVSLRNALNARDRAAEVVQLRPQPHGAV